MSLFELLKNWNDREAIQAGVERAGYNVHTIYQDELKALAVRSGYSDLTKYWNELAREWIACAGKVDSRRRLFQSNVGYRSRYLDQLAEERSGQNISMTAALHPCEREFNENLESSGLGFALTSDSEALKNFSGRIDASGSINRKSSVDDLRDYLCAQLVVHGFMRSGSNFKIKLDNDLILTAGIEKSKSIQIIQLLIFLKISMHGSSEDLYFGDFSRLIPGFKYNAIILSDIGVSYGLKAHASIIGEIARSFGRLSHAER